MREIHLSAVAEEDLIDIWRHTRNRWGAAQADRYLEELEKGITRLAADAGIGVERSGVRGGYRALFIKSHVIYYKIVSGEIRIVRVLHGRMDPEAKLES